MSRSDFPESSGSQYSIVQKKNVMYEGSYESYAFRIYQLYPHIFHIILLEYIFMIELYYSCSSVASSNYNLEVVVIKHSKHAFWVVFWGVIFFFVSSKGRGVDFLIIENYENSRLRGSGADLELIFQSSKGRGGVWPIN